MRARWLRAGVFIVGTAALAGAHAAAAPLRLEQVFPRIAGKNQVRWYDFDWKQVDFKPDPAGAPMRLFFYASEREVAAIAEALIREAYLDLAAAFDYRPAHRIPFLLYNSHFEFESTHAFFVSEQVLGITSTEDLKMAIPYWGEHRRFIEVMRHELAHQFTIQKVWSRGRDAECNPLQFMPLWFVEGLAQYYAYRALTPDVRAVLVERAVFREKGKDLPAFFPEGELSFERVYLIGHAQVTFLEETFGRGTLQKLLDRSPELCYRRSFFGSDAGSLDPFADLVAAVTGVDDKEVKRLWLAWVDRVVAPARAAATPRSALHALDDLGIGQPDSFALSPDGKTIFYRTLDFDTGVARLYLRDVDDAGSRRQIAVDQSLGLISLHPLDRRVTALNGHRLAYIGRVGASDVLWVRSYRRREDGDGVRFELGDPVAHPLNQYGDLIEGGYPAVHPQTGAVAFVGLDRKGGFLDVYELTRPAREDSPLRTLTRDAYAEQGLAYDADGRLYLATDATADGRYEIVRLDAGRKVRVTALPGFDDALAPAPATDGVAFQSGRSGRMQIYLATPRGALQVTDVPTALQAPAFDPAGRLYGVALLGGKRRLVRVARADLVGLPVTAPAAAGPLAPFTIPRGALAGVDDYDATDPSNYGLVGAQAAAALGTVAAGTIVFADLFNNHVFGVSAFYAGQADLGEFTLGYLNRSSRLAKGGSIFLTNGLQLEGPDGDGVIDTFLLQRFGASFDTEYPLSRFLRLTASIAPERLRAYRFSDAGGRFASRFRMSVFATEARTSFALDTLRLSLFGPVRGQSWVVEARGTLTGGETDPFGSLSTDYQFYYPFLRGYERWVGSLRLAAGTSAGGAFREQFYLPAAYNLRTLPEGSVALFGEHYYLAQAETTFPLSPVWGGALYVQGVVGADAGAVSFDVNRAWRERRGAGVLGTNFGLGPVIVRFHFARPIPVGGDHPAKNLWRTYLSIALSPLAFAQ